MASEIGYFFFDKMSHHLVRDVDEHFTFSSVEASSINDLLVRPARRIVLMAVVSEVVVMILVFLLFDQLGLGSGSILGISFETVRRVLVILGAMLVMYVWLYQFTTTLRVGQDEVTLRYGIITRNLLRVEIQKIANYTYHRSTLELILGLVNLEVESSSATDTAPGITMRYMCMLDAEAVMTRIRGEKERSGTERI